MIELRADRYHAGLRLGTLAAWLASLALVFVICLQLAGLIFGPLEGGALVLVGLPALLLAQPLAMWVEKQLMARWPSGRAVQLDGSRLALQGMQAGAAFDLARKTSYWRWQFSVRGRRGGRVPNGHVCLALRLVQEQNTASLYAFAAPAEAEALMAEFPFYEVRRPNDKGRFPLGGRDAVYLAAEEDRWSEGAELEPADLRTLLDHLARHIPDFKAGPSS